ncbi:F-box only protein 28-like [Patiria miniata]|uniref:F-box domain-containing protein n=1 Tax=Patiria miniata TaxID=46514 RepID=A0A913Z021_PATMI|nr:F-box only protein 28-like [Patiria miniata]
MSEDRVWRNKTYSSMHRSSTSSSGCAPDADCAKRQPDEAEELKVCRIVALPDMILRQILQHTTYEHISELRLVCRHFNRVCQDLLSHGSRQLNRYHAKCFKSLKAQLPKRESERREHPLAKRCDILSAVETRLSLLSMTYSKYMDLQLCCFIPGKVIDEAFAVLRHVQHAKDLLPMSELLKELRDISSMAIEHFDEEIVPTLKKKRVFQGPPSLSGEVLPSNNIFKQIMELKTSLKKRDNFTAALSRKINTCVAHRKLIAEQGQKILQQEQVITELRNKVSEQCQSLVSQERRLALLEERVNRYTVNFDLLPEVASGAGSMKRKEASRDEGEGAGFAEIVSKKTRKT